MWMDKFILEYVKQNQFQVFLIRNVNCQKKKLKGNVSTSKKI